jgi:hypothetical protein
MGTLTITPSFGSHWGNAPFDYTSTVNAVCTMFCNAFTPINDCLVTINFDYGFVDGSSVSGGGAKSQYFISSTHTYSTIRTKLQALSNPSSLQTNAYTNFLPSTDVFGGGETMWTPNAWDCAVGFQTITNNFTVGFVGLGSSFARAVDTDGTQTSSAFATIAHEVSEILGRGTNIGLSGIYYPMDIWTYSAANTRAFGVGNYYVSGDGGATSLATLFNNGGNPNNGDSGDSTVTGDAYNAFVQTAAPSRSSSLPLQDYDWKWLNLIGWTLSATGLTWAGLDPSFAVSGASAVSMVGASTNAQAASISGASSLAFIGRNASGAPGRLRLGHG